MFVRSWNWLMDSLFAALDRFYGAAEHVLGSLTICSDCGKPFGWGEHDNCDIY